MALRRDANIYQDLTKALTADVGSNGVLTVASTEGLFVNERVRLYDNINTPAVLLTIMEIISATQFTVGEAVTITKHVISVKDCSAFTVANGATIRTIAEARNIPEQGSIALAAYEPSPVNAFRVQSVDAQGNFTNTINIVPAPIASLVEIAPQFGELDYSAIAGNSAGTADTVLTLNADRSILQVFNSLNADIGITYDGTQYWHLEPFDGFVLDFRSNNLKLGNGKVIGVFYTGLPALAGSIRITAT